MERLDPPGPVPTPAPEAAASRSELVQRTLALVAPLDAPVLFLGEAGAGRSFLARRIHAASPRAGRRLASVDCRALGSSPSAAAELWSSLKGAAASSVLFEGIDHLAEHLQAKLVAWIEEIHARWDAPRLLSTTSLDLGEEVLRGRFREDLHSRIDVFEIRVPPLREHRADIPCLAREFLAESAARLRLPVPRLPEELERALVEYGWPGNVRELRSAMERAVALSSGPTIERWALGPKLQAPP